MSKNESCNMTSLWTCCQKINQCILPSDVSARQKSYKISPVQFPYSNDTPMFRQKCSQKIEEN